MDTKLVKKLTDNSAEIEQVEAQIMEATADLQTKLKTLREQDSEVRGAIKEAMEKHGVKKFENDQILITYVAPSVRKTLDSKRLKEEAPGIYDKYVKDTEVSASVRIKAKEA